MAPEGSLGTETTPQRTENGKASPDSVFGSRDGKHGGFRAGLSYCRRLGEFCLSFARKTACRATAMVPFYSRTAIELGAFPTL